MFSVIFLLFSLIKVARHQDMDKMEPNLAAMVVEQTGRCEGLG
jgi:hypothetical protein